MKISLLAPFNPKSPEVGLMYLLANFLREGGVSVSQIRCNGVFSQCDRDGEFGWKRTVSSCLSCIQDQRQLAQWSSIPAQELSKHILPENVRTSARWVNSLTPEELLVSKLGNTPLTDLMKGSVAARFGIPAIDPRNKNHEAFARRLALATLRSIGAAQEFLKAEQPGLLMMSSSESFLSKAFSREAAVLGIPAYIFTADFSRRCVTIQETQPKQHATPVGPYLCPLLIDDLESLRPDVKSWAPDLMRLLEEIRAYIGVQFPPKVASAGR